MLDNREEAFTVISHKGNNRSCISGKYFEFITRCFYVGVAYFLNENVEFRNVPLFVCWTSACLSVCTCIILACQRE